MWHNPVVSRKNQPHNKMNQNTVTIGAKVVGIANNTKYVGNVIGFDAGTPVVKTRDGYLAIPNPKFAY